MNFGNKTKETQVVQVLAWGRPGKPSRKPVRRIKIREVVDARKGFEGRSATSQVQREIDNPGRLHNETALQLPPHVCRRQRPTWSPSKKKQQPTG